MLERLFEPKAVAVVGASREERKIGHSLVKNLLDGGYKGKIFPVNPKASDILGLKCFPSVRATGQEVDLAIVSVPAPLVPPIIEDCGKSKAGAAVIISAGFKESGPEGRQLERRVAEIASGYGVRVLGPNCLGFINTSHNLNASFSQGMPKAGEISFFSQSGALCTAILDRALGEGIGFSKFVSLGNKMDINETDLLDFLGADPDTRVVLGYIEGVENGIRFMEAARRTTRLKPVIAVKSGGTGAGARAASSHTGALAGSESTFKAAFHQTGIIRAPTIEALFDFALAFAWQPVPKIPGLGIVTNAGGPGIIAADSSERSGVPLASLGKTTVEELRKNLPPSAAVYNPVDLIGDADEGRYELAVRTLLEEQSVGGILVILTPQAMTRSDETAERVAKAASRKQKPVLACFMGDISVKNAVKNLSTRRIPNYPYPERAVAAYRAMLDQQDWQRKPSPKYRPYQLSRARVMAVLERARAEGRTNLGDADAREIVSACGFRVPETHIAETSEQAVRAAEIIGFPVAMKVVSPDILHKSDVGGVMIGLEGAKAVREAFQQVTFTVHEHMPEATVLGVAVQQMITGGKELIVGMVRDLQFGPVLMFGLGGIYVEVMKDTAFRIAPLSVEDAREMVRDIRAFPLLQGVRGESPVDLAAVEVALLRMSHLAVAVPDILEMDINPLTVLPPGEGTVAVDARLTITPSADLSPSGRGTEASG